MVSGCYSCAATMRKRSHVMLWLASVEISLLKSCEGIGPAIQLPEPSYKLSEVRSWKTKYGKSAAIWMETGRDAGWSWSSNGVNAGWCSLTTGLPLKHLLEMNYSSWSFKMQVLHKKEGLWMMIDKNPCSPLTDNWTLKDEKVQATIALWMEDSQLAIIRGSGNAKAMWIALQNFYLCATAGSKVYLTWKLHRASLIPGDSLSLHLQRIVGLFGEVSCGEWNL